MGSRHKKLSGSKTIHTFILPVSQANASGFFLKILPNFRKFIFARLDGFICALGVLPNRRLFPKRPKQVIIVGSGVAAACRSSRFSHI
jgi:hypothetical protein